MSQTGSQPIIKHMDGNDRKCGTHVYPDAVIFPISPICLCGSVVSNQVVSTQLIRARRVFYGIDIKHSLSNISSHLDMGEGFLQSVFNRQVIN